MALIEITRVSKNARYGIWHITETLEQLSEAYAEFLQTEPYLNHFKNEKRKKEALAARLIVKNILEKDELKFSGIERDNVLKPRLKEYDSLFINLSHSWPYAVGVVNTVSPVGIDIEKISDRPMSIARKYMSYDERNHAQTDSELFTAYWCAKETLYKAYGQRKIAFKQHLKVEPFDMLSTNMLKGTITTKDELLTVDIHLRRFNEFLIACNIQL